MTVKIRIVITEHKKRYWAEALGFPPMAVDGATPAEARHNAVKAVRLYLKAAASAVPTARRAQRAVQVVDAVL